MGGIHSLLLSLYAVWTSSLSFGILLRLVGCPLLLLVWLNSMFLSVVTFAAIEELPVRLRVETGLCSAILSQQLYH